MIETQGTNQLNKVDLAIGKFAELRRRGGEDTGTPVIHEYDAKMPFKFTGTLEKVQIKLGPNELAPQQRGELEQLKRDFALAVQ